MFLLNVAPAALASGQAARSDAGLSAQSPSLSYARSLPAISVLDAVPAADDDASPFDESPLDLNLILLAGWLPLAGALLALAMEGPSGTGAREARSSLWVE